MAATVLLSLPGCGGDPGFAGVQDHGKASYTIFLAEGLGTHELNVHPALQTAIRDGVRKTVLKVRKAVSKTTSTTVDDLPQTGKSENDESQEVNGREDQAQGHELHGHRYWIDWVVTFVPGVFWLVSLIPALLFYKPSGISTSIKADPVNIWNSTTLKLDPDIGGTGIRIGIYIPIGLALLTLLAGLLHNEDSGAKEIGNAQLLTLFYLNFNAVKAAAPRFKKLTFPEVMVACMSIDLTAAGLQMTTSGKESLASRWFVFASGLNQLIAASIVCVMLSRIRHNYAFSTDNCADINWWGRVDSCTGPSKSTWAYLAARWCILLHGLWLDWRYAQDFHRIEKDWRSLASGDQETDKRKSEFEDTAYPYGRLRATVFSKWAEFLPSILVAMVGIEVLVRRVSLDSNITDWGQSAALVLAIAGAIHWGYVIDQVRIELTDRDYRKLRPVDYPRYANEWLPRQSDWNKRLLAAAKEGDIKAMRQTLRHANVNHVEDGMTALLYAVRFDNVDLVIELMSRKPGAQPVIEGATPAVSFAAEHGSLNVLKHFIPEPSPQQEGSIGLKQRMKRAFERNLTMAFRTDAGRSDQVLNPLDRNDRSILWLAAVNGQKEIIRYVLGVWNPQTTEQEFLKPDQMTKRTLLFELAETGKHKILMSPLLELCPRPILGNTLKQAVEQRNIKALETLVKCRLGPLAVNETGSSIFHLMSSDPGPNSLLSPLGNLHVRTGQTFDIGDATGRTPLHIAILSNAQEPAKLLAFYDANPHVKDNSGDTPFWAAIRSQNEDLIAICCYRQFYDEDLIASIRESPNKVPSAWPSRFRSSALYSNKPLFLHALEKGYVSLFIALMKTSEGWPQGSLKPDGKQSSDLSPGPDSLVADLEALLSKMSGDDRTFCEQRIREGGGGAYLKPHQESTTHAQ
ncbi:hypothetical protein PRZ48_006874 [Zasmidium cellare]|uniref:Uncharacterized protein n=1 Tax=Zasmidium cellare TaxID=395010 RepID=A0ABR0EJ43_ZASCE|nr:hypothetical protein PRZ48_006874 [Zasmidium cellare]